MRLLLAESDSALAEFLKSRFQEETFTVSVLPAPQDVAKVADSELFDLILVDLDAPASSGSDCLHPLQRRWPDSPLIILAAEASVEERVRVLNAGADDFVAKPFAVAELVARARAALRPQPAGARPRLLRRSGRQSRFSSPVPCRAYHRAQSQGIRPARLPAPQRGPTGLPRLDHRGSLGHAD